MRYIYQIKKLNVIKTLKTLNSIEILNVANDECHFPLKLCNCPNLQTNE